MKKILSTIIFVLFLISNCNSEVITMKYSNFAILEKKVIGTVFKKGHCVEFYIYDNNKTIQKEVFFKDGTSLRTHDMSSMNSYERKEFLKELNIIVKIYDANISVKEIDSKKICYHRIKGR